MSDIVDVIKAQHRQVDSLLSQAEEKAEQERYDEVRTLVRQVATLLEPHSQAEESFVYPRIAELDEQERDEVHDGTAEHHHVEGLLQELLTEDPGTPGYDGKLAAMTGEIRHHVEEEEQDLLPVLTERCSDQERAAMGERFRTETGAAAPADGGSVGPSADASRLTKGELYEKARQQDIPGRSTMSKDELARAVDPT